MLEKITTQCDGSLWYQKIGVVDRGSNAPVDLFIMHRLHCLIVARGEHIPSNLEEDLNCHI